MANMGPLGQTEIAGARSPHERGIWKHRAASAAIVLSGVFL